MELQRRRARHLEIRDSVPRFWCPREAANDRSLVDRYDDYSGADHCMGEAVHDRARVRAAAINGLIEALSRRAYESLQSAWQWHQRQGDGTDCRCASQRWT